MDKLNTSDHCALCADDLVRSRSYQGNSATRIEVRGVKVCPVHDLGGAATAYPVNVRAAIEATS